MGRRVRLVVLASGRGTNFSAIASAVNAGKIPGATLVALVTNNPAAKAIERAKAVGVPVHVVDSQTFRRNGKLDRDAYERKLVETLDRLAPDLVCLAGYMLILGPRFLGAFPERVLNIHPSLLPAFPGLRAQRQAIEAGARVTGATVHFVTADLDDGPIVAQNEIPVLEGDTETTLAERLLPVEHRTYVEALQRLASRKYRIEGKRVLWDPA